MPLNVKRKKLDESLSRYCFEGDVNIYTVSKLKKIIIDGLDQMNKIELDFNGIGKFDSAGLQLLVHISREAERLNKDIVIIGASDKVKEVFCTYDLCF